MKSDFEMLVMLQEAVERCVNSGDEFYGVAKLCDAYDAVKEHLEGQQGADSQ
jgi:hypothetical protein